jgi:Zn-dependent metalloprotease
LECDLEVTVSNDEIQDKVMSFLTLLEVPEFEIYSVKARNVEMIDKENGDAISDLKALQERTKAVGKYAVVRRGFRGIPVEGDNVRIMFDNTGRTLGMFGRWRELNYQNSQFSSNLTEEDFAKIAIEKLRGQKARINTDKGVELGASYAVEKDINGEFVLKPKGFAHYTYGGTDDPELEGVGEYVGFDL